MVVYAATVDDFDSGATATLPSGSTGDQLILITHTYAVPSTLSGWTRQAVYNEAPLSGRLTLYTRTRGASETTMTLPFVSPDVEHVYALISATGVVYNSYDANYLNDPFPVGTWEVHKSFDRQAPRVAFLLHATTGALSSVTGDFVDQGDYTDPNGNESHIYVADESSGTLDYDAEGAWSTNGGAPWMVAFFSPPAGGGGWNVGMVGWPDDNA